MNPSLHGRRIAVVGPVPPPYGGMANQTRQLIEHLEKDGASVLFVPTNPPYRPAWTASWIGLRAAARLLGYLPALRRAASRVDVAHVMASSGWAWHLFAAPAVWTFSGRGVPVVVNYRGGNAESFFAGSFRAVAPTLSRAAAVAVPSAFLQRVFAARGIEATVVPNVIDRSRFAPSSPRREPVEGSPHLVVARNLEPIYDVATAIRAFGRVRASFPGARLTIAGMGPERAALERLATETAPAGAIAFTGRLENEAMADLYRTADVVVNPSLVDNMPISILEALSSGVPVVSTNVGGVPDLVRDGVHALLVPPGDPAAMAAAIVRVAGDRPLRDSLRAEGERHVSRFTWERIGPEWAALYERVARTPSAPALTSRA